MSVPNLQFNLKNETLFEVKWSELLQDDRFTLLYGIDDETGKMIYGHSSDPQSVINHLEQLEGVESVTLFVPQETDWEKVWEEHAPTYNKEKKAAEIDLKSLSKNTRVHTIYLKPGPGFGDLSHPTTRLVLKLMSERVEGKNVVDIGSGSGILSLCALGLGARHVVGIDIDPQANAHATLNAVLNNFESEIAFLEPDAWAQYFPKEQNIFLMNMIRSEQIQAWESLKSKGALTGEMITSGILNEERGVYIKQCKERGWKLLEEISEGEWRGFRFKIDFLRN